MRRQLLAWVGSLVAMAIGVACGTSSRTSGFGSSSSDDGGTTNDPAFVTGDAGTVCSGLGCSIATDCNGSPTTLRGKVFDPAGKNPLYNVQVYIPGGLNPTELPPFKDSTKDGVSCDTCASKVVSPLRSAITDATGEFKLEDVPVVKDLPLVIQVGKWRRLFKVDASNKCALNIVPDSTLRLPSRGSEGDMPQIAVTTGAYDALECLLRGIGVDESEFIEGHGGGGHVHLFKGAGGGMGTPAADFWTDATQLKMYDLLLLSCEGNEYNQSKGNLDSVYEYVNAGGKAFATHFHYTWFKNAPAAEFKNIAAWGGSSVLPSSAYDVNQTFPKGAEFAKWLYVTGASPVLGQISLEDVKTSISSINQPALGWIHSPKKAEQAKYFSFNTPIGVPVENQCGRAVFSDVHISSTGGPPSLDACAPNLKKNELTGQQKALEFLFFDLSSCVTDETKTPEPPK